MTTNTSRRFAAARWKIFRARSLAEFERHERTLRTAAASGIAEAWYVLFDAYRARRPCRDARASALQLFEHGDEDDRIALALDCIYANRFGTPNQQRRRGFDPALGLGALERRARAGEVASMYWLARVLRLGGPIRRNERRS